MLVLDGGVLALMAFILLCPGVQIVCDGVHASMLGILSCVPDPKTLPTVRLESRT